MKKLVSIIGDSKIEKDGDKYNVAFSMGKALVDNGYRVASGGLSGVMEAAFAGAKSSKFYQEGDTVAILPMFDRSAGNSSADIIIATGLDIYRNVIVANSDAVIAIGGGAGTLSEICNAWPLKRLMLAFENVNGWSSKVANTRLDKRIRYPQVEEDRIFGVKTADEAIALLEKYINIYTDFHTGIKKL
ncbi:MAG: acyl-CoA synthetase [Clostridia bacterium]